MDGVGNLRIQRRQFIEVAVLLGEKWPKQKEYQKKCFWPLSALTT